MLDNAALENLSDSRDINRAEENNREKNNISAEEGPHYSEWAQHKAWFIKKFSKYLHQRKQTKWQRLQYLKHSNRETLNNVRCVKSTHFRNKKDI